MRLSLAAALALFASAAHAHIVFDTPGARPGAYHAAALRVSHGCGDSPTVAIRVEIPASITAARPQPKPGWALTLEREPLATPVATEGGDLQRERVKAVTWRGRLPTDQFDTFALLVRTPPRAGVLAVPAVQTCERGDRRWTDAAAPDQPWNSVQSPAPVLTVTAPADAPPQAGHHH